jgi:hypothetical protein
VANPICQLPIAGRDFATIEALVGRNDSCPCEGGRKFKRCLLLRSRGGVDGSPHRAQVNHPRKAFDRALGRTRTFQRP